MNTTKKAMILLLLILVSISVGKGLYTLKAGFSCRRIHSLSQKVPSISDPQILKALSQPFYYLGRGRQCFAFVSEDEKYVLKLPRTDIYTIPFWTRALPCKTYREKLRANQTERLAFILSSFQISYEDLKEQTGTLALHLGQSEEKGETLTLIDRIGCKYRLSLEKTPFILQYKHPILMQAFLKALKKKERSEAEHILEVFISSVIERAKKGILNRDRSFLRNYGYDGKYAYQIDIGSFFRLPDLKKEAAFQKSVRDSMDPVQEWLAKIDPEILLFFNKKLGEQIE